MTNQRIYNTLKNATVINLAQIFLKGEEMCGNMSHAIYHTYGCECYFKIWGKDQKVVFSSRFLYNIKIIEICIEKIKCGTVSLIQMNKQKWGDIDVIVS